MNKFVRAINTAKCGIFPSNYITMEALPCAAEVYVNGQIINGVVDIYTAKCHIRLDD